MVVAYNQIEELDRIFRKYLPPARVRALLIDLKRTIAYQQNKSFAETVDRLLAQSRS